MINRTDQGTLSSVTLAQWLEQTEGGVEAFLKQMSRSDEWGDHVAVQAAAELYHLVYD